MDLAADHYSFNDQACRRFVEKLKGRSWTRKASFRPAATESGPRRIDPRKAEFPPSARSSGGEGTCLDEMAPTETEAPAVRVRRIGESRWSSGACKHSRTCPSRSPPVVISAVIGPNGAGKTTLFNCISGVARHDGTVELEGRDLSRLRADRRAALGIARTFQTPLLIPDLIAIDNVLLGAHSQLRGGLLGSIFRLPAVRSDERLMRGRASELLARLGLDAERCARRQPPARRPEEGRGRAGPAARPPAAAARRAGGGPRRRRGLRAPRARSRRSRRRTERPAYSSSTTWGS